jgi:adenylate cyclase
MGIEIERKFLVDTAQLPWVTGFAKDTGFTQNTMRQGYLSQDPTVRLRIVDLSPAVGIAKLTIKGPGLLARAEFEYEIPYADGLAMWPLVKHSLEKRRHFIPYGAHVWEVDEYLGNLLGLWTAEIELKSETEVFDPPPWVTEEVTYNREFSNVSLAKHGWPLDMLPRKR